MGYATATREPQIPPSPVSRPRKYQLWLFNKQADQVVAPSSTGSRLLVEDDHWRLRQDPDIEQPEAWRRRWPPVLVSQCAHARMDVPVGEGFARPRICAPRQRMTATFQERKTLGSTTFGRYARSVAFSHAGGCRWRTMKWKLRDEFFGIGTYSVTGQLFDSQGKSSRRLTRRSVTND